MQTIFNIMRKEKIVLLISLALLVLGLCFYIFRIYENKQAMQVYEAKVHSVDYIALEKKENEDGFEQTELTVSAVYLVIKNEKEFYFSFQDTFVNPSMKDESFYLSLKPGCTVTVYHDLSGYSLDNPASRYIEGLFVLSVLIILFVMLLLSKDESNNEEVLLNCQEN